MIRPFAALIALLAINAAALAEFGGLVNTITRTDADRFGQQVEVLDNHLVVSAPGPDHTSAITGTIYLYEHANNTLTLRDTRTEHNPIGAAYGLGLDTHGDFIVAASRASADLYTIDQGAFVHLSSHNLQVDFEPIGGQYVAATNNLLITGSPDLDGGRVNVINLNTSSTTTLALPQDDWFGGQRGGPWPGRARFGFAVDASNDYVVVGAPLAEVDGLTNAGRAYVYSATSAELLYELETGTPRSGRDHIGLSTVIHDRSVFLPDLDAEAVYQFDLDTGSITNVFHTRNVLGSYLIGRELAVTDNLLAVADLVTYGVALFDIRTGLHLTTLRQPAGYDASQFGFGLAFSDQHLYVGDPAANSVFIYDITSPPLAGDLDDSGVLDENDLNILSWGVFSGQNDYDLDESGITDADDLRFWIERVYDSVVGDANLDHAVDLIDLSILASNFGSLSLRWDHGNFDGSRAIDLIDLSLLAANFGIAPPIPEPTAISLILASWLTIAHRTPRTFRRTPDHQPPQS
ncbi:MAG: hypothetical protein RIG82_02065 [Phycisphaeraceae bacterium]